MLLHGILQNHILKMGTPLHNVAAIFLQKDFDTEMTMGVFGTQLVVDSTNLYMSVFITFTTKILVHRINHINMDQTIVKENRSSVAN